MYRQFATLLHRQFQVGKSPLAISQAKMEQRQTVGRDVSSGRHLFEPKQQFLCLIEMARAAMRMAQHGESIRSRGDGVRRFKRENGVIKRALLDQGESQHEVRDEETRREHRRPAEFPNCIVRVALEVARQTRPYVEERCQRVQGLGLREAT